MTRGREWSLLQDADLKESLPGEGVVRRGPPRDTPAETIEKLKAAIGASPMDAPASTSLPPLQGGLKIAALGRYGAGPPRGGAPESLGRHETKPVSSHVRWKLSRNFVANFVTVTNFVKPPISALARGAIGMLARPASAAQWGLAKLPTCLTPTKTVIPALSVSNPDRRQGRSSVIIARDGECSASI